MLRNYVLRAKSQTTLAINGPIYPIKIPLKKQKQKTPMRGDLRAGADWRKALISEIKK
jgi:hypothetical protein